MPDVTISCSECAREYKISEYASVEGLACRTCGAKMSKPTHEKDSTLALRSSSSSQMLSDWHPDDDDQTASGPVVHPAPPVSTHHVEKVPHAPKWLAGIVMLIVAGILIGFQYKADLFQSYMGEYAIARNVVAAAAYLFVVLAAFQEHIGPGAGCLLFPPYAIVYSMTSVESWLLRGVLYGMVIGLVTETYLLPDDALFMSASKEMNSFIDSVDTMMVRASDSPILDD
jgi:hypothetical protein